MFTQISRRVTLALAATLILLTCGTLAYCLSPVAIPENYPTADLVVTESQSGKTLNLNDHKTVRVEVFGNASTGYNWSLTKIDGDALEQLGDVESVGPQSTKPGDGSTIVFKFRPVKIGKATITLAYARPWEKDKAPIQTFTITIIVDKAPTTAPATAPTTRP